MNTHFNHLLAYLKQHRLVALLVYLVLTLLVYGATAFRLYDHDCFAYAQAAKGLLNGQILYRTTWMDKPPITILFFAVPQLFKQGSFLSLQLFLGFWLFLQSLLYFLLLPKDLKIARWVCAFFVTFVPLTRTDFIWPSTENISNLFVTINLLIAFRIWYYKRFNIFECLLVGAATCFALNSRQNTVLFGLVPAVAVLLAHDSIRNKLMGLLAMAGSFFSVFILILAWLLGWGDLQGYFYTVFEYPRLYAGSSSIKNGILLVKNFLKTPFCLLLFITTALSIFSKYRFLVIMALGLGILGCLAPLKPYSHYWANLIPVMGLQLATWFEKSSLAEFKLKRLLLGSLATYVFILGAQTVRESISRPNINKFAEVATTVDRVSNPKSTLFVSGPQASFIQFATKTPPANVYFWDVQLNRYHAYILPQKIDVILNEYIAKPPRILAIHHKQLGRINSGDDELSKGEQMVFNLLQKIRYKSLQQVNNWTVFVRENDSAARYRSESF